MAPTIVVGTNSYATEAESLTILEEFVFASSWPFALNRVPSLITAFYDIGQFDLIDPVTGVAVDASAAPTPVKQAQCIIAHAFSQNPTIANQNGVGGTNIKSAGAGSARVTFFRPEDKTRFPVAALRLLQPYLSGGSSSGIGGSCATGVDGVSSFGSGGSEGLSEGFK